MECLRILVRLVIGISSGTLSSIQTSTRRWLMKISSFPSLRATGIWDIVSEAIAAAWKVPSEALARGNGDKITCVCCWFFDSGCLVTG